jgi:hypothetical protein
MNQIEEIQQCLKQECPYIHNSRLQALMDVACALQKSKKMSLSEIGRNLAGESKIKHKIKKVDRLEGNEKLHNELDSLYKGISKFVLRYIATETIKHVVVDLCCIQDSNNIVMLSAEIAVKGRTLPLYRLIFKIDEQTQMINKFLLSLSKCIPDNKQVVLVMDAGFGEEWLKSIEKLGWHWLVRIRRGKNVKLSPEHEWLSIKDFIPLIGEKTHHYPNGVLSQTHKRQCRIITTKRFSEQDKRCKPKVLPGYYNAGRKSYSISAREPWILGTNLPKEYKASEIINIYGKRMQIEESFRDIKSRQFGLGSRNARSESVYRWGVKMLVAAIVQVLIWVVGVFAYYKGMHLEFQPNTEKKRKVFSYFFLGKLVIEHNRLKDLDINPHDLESAFKSELGI